MAVATPGWFGAKTALRSVWLSGPVRDCWLDLLLVVLFCPWCCTRNYVLYYSCLADPVSVEVYIYGIYVNARIVAGEVAPCGAGWATEHP